MFWINGVCHPRLFPGDEGPQNTPTLFPHRYTCTVHTLNHPSKTTIVLKHTWLTEKQYLRLRVAAVYALDRQMQELLGTSGWDALKRAHISRGT